MTAIPAAASAILAVAEANPELAAVVLGATAPAIIEATQETASHVTSAIDEVYDGIVTNVFVPTTKTMVQMQRWLYLQARELFIKKNTDYTSGLNGESGNHNALLDSENLPNDNDGLANFRGAAARGVDPGIGVLIRIDDKLARLTTFLNNGKLAIVEESALDCCLDVINYATILYAYIAEQGKYPVTLLQDHVTNLADARISIDALSITPVKQVS